MKTEKIIGILLIIGVIGVIVPYTVLTIIFDYPKILRQDTGIILLKFQEGGTILIWTWWAFALLGLPILEACVLLGQKLETKFYFVRWATILGIIGLTVQIIGLLRWTFVVPVLAKEYVLGNDVTKEVTTIAFKVVHQYGGVILGEHIGQIFTIAWTLMLTAAFAQLKLFSKWVIWLGYICSAIYLLAQAELFSTVVPSFPVWSLAGFIGSTLWLIWLLAVGIKMLQTKIE